MKRVGVIALLAGLAAAIPFGVHANAGIQPYTATEITVYTSTTPQQTTAPTVTQDKPGKPPTAPKPSSGKVNLSYFIGSWKTHVPGATFTTPGEPGSGTDVQHTSAGSGSTGKLVIRANHTWRWQGKRGRWKRTGDADYPIVLIKAVDGHDWKVGADKGHTIVIWDGFTWFVGQK